ncbi:uncharacterized protein DS421_6g197730 [Arachis hypogaea]|nr:uncharacterized protein DS421_6g197730 [Arachis hypogaea]
MTHYMFISFVVILLLCASFLSAASASSSGNEFNGLASLVVGRKLLECPCWPVVCPCPLDSKSAP